jgi:hypothetical protein
MPTSSVFKVRYVCRISAEIPTTVTRRIHARHLRHVCRTSAQIPTPRLSAAATQSHALIQASSVTRLHLPAQPSRATALPTPARAILATPGTTAILPAPMSAGPSPTIVSPTSIVDRATIVITTSVGLLMATAALPAPVLSVRRARAADVFQSLVSVSRTLSVSQEQRVPTAIRTQSCVLLSPTTVPQTFRARAASHVQNMASAIPTATPRCIAMVLPRIHVPPGIRATLPTHAVQSSWITAHRPLEEPATQGTLAIRRRANVNQTVAAPRLAHALLDKLAA